MEGRWETVVRELAAVLVLMVWGLKLA